MATTTMASRVQLVLDEREARDVPREYLAGLLLRHGGRITVDSRRGHGTTVTLCLPAAIARVIV